MSRSALLESLAAVSGEDRDGVYFGDEDDLRYVDFSCVDADGIRTLEVGDEEGDAVQLHLTRDEMLRLHATLTRTLLRA